MIGQGELRTPHAAREQEQKQYVPPPGDIIMTTRGVLNIQYSPPHNIKYFLIVNSDVARLISHKSVT